ncbi:putative chromatin regulator PHD family [Arabidopsis thaliana]|uniref:Phorbol-ester/DAG-type domain-containing protein n=2 Tax=Arabidopsis TaxID=3701 RepID=A0A178VE12_ARATH|nr:Protein kinase C-like phorbol ester/diacylglycerol-binding domain [Arabidopsis thaliana x Arabidopsis arenosa]OAP03911.1 hypothetical protein AXX17_AT3G30000 [Arabidopsis thaliana]
MTENVRGHEHLVSVVNQGDGMDCDACDQLHVGGYSCSECKFNIHKKCVYVFTAKEIFDHPSHDGHCLKLLTTGAPDHTDPKCHLCGKNTKRLLYHCSDCKLNLDIGCIADHRSAPFHLNMSWHHHPLVLGLSYFDRCSFCHKIGNEDSKGYRCLRCGLVIHTRCTFIFDSPEITHPAHVRHPLKRLTDGAPNYTDHRCHICGENTGNLLYHCDICKFNLDMRCAIERPPPVALSNLKVHEHTLTLMPRLISFVCDACGTKGDRSPYMCVQCDFMTFHQKCARLPRVIHVNHHDHRVSFKYPLGPGEWRCGVCWEEIDWSYGAYSCSLCPNYAIHSLCATRKDVWDGIELDGVPEEIEDIEPFKRNDDSTITHCAHQHNLMSLRKDGEENSLCGACVRPIGSYTFYKCSESECIFILHEMCANLRKKKRHFLSPEPLHLSVLEQSDDSPTACSACLQVCSEGFVYDHDTYGTFDLLCSSIDVPFIHGSHPHPLLYLKLQHGHFKTCQSCGIDHTKVVIGCLKCNYFLDFRCATLPLTVSLPRYDDHPLTLCYGEKSSGKYWCDICERETNPETWFYTGSESGVTLHILCVLGDIRYAKPGGNICEGGFVLPNNSSTRPICYNCHCRCPGTFIVLGWVDYDPEFFCSFYCFKSHLKFHFDEYHTVCPPWALELESNTSW